MPRVTNLETGHTHSLSDHQHSHAHHEHDHTHKHGQTIHIQQTLLSKNDELARANKTWFQERQILALNLVSSPGSGKTTLLEQTIRHFQRTMPVSVIEGDQETLHDAQRIQHTGAPVVQINTGAGCHLEADMLARGLQALNPPDSSLLMIENVGNLVCPALFNLGEQAKVAILSVTEGEDKPLKYPHMFQASTVMLLNKIDLLPYLSFNMAKCEEYAKTANPHMKIFHLSALTGEGMPQWYEWIHQQHQHMKQPKAAKC